MKNQLIILLSCILGSYSFGYGQTGYQDGQVTYYKSNSIQLGQSQYYRVVGEWYRHDSSSNGVNFFTIYDKYITRGQTSENSIKPAYRLKEATDSVWFTGPLTYWADSTYKSTEPYKNVLIYDFSMQVRDTLWVLNETYVVDSTYTVVTTDGKRRKAQDIHYLGDTRHPSQTTILQGVGVSEQTLPFERIQDVWSPSQSILGICANDQEILRTEEGDSYENINYCDSSVVFKELTAGIGLMAHRINAYPNPVLDLLTVEGLSGDFTIMNTIGKVVMRGVFHDKLDVSGLPSGQYFVLVDAEETQYYFRVIKVE